MPKGHFIERFILISGCSGGGKSTMLDELHRRGYHVIEEPGRRIVAAAHASGGNAVPWKDMTAFANQAIELARADRLRAATQSGLVFFDRGLIDAASALEAATGLPGLHLVAGELYNRLVFMVPPWPEIYENDSERQHDFDAAVAEYERLLLAFAALDYEVGVLPCVTLAKRADFVLRRIFEAEKVG